MQLLDTALGGVDVLEGSRLSRGDTDNRDGVEGGEGGGIAGGGHDADAQAERPGCESRICHRPAEPRTAGDQVFGEMTEDEVVDWLEGHKVKHVQIITGGLIVG